MFSRLAARSSIANLASVSGARTFAASALARETVRPPISLSGLDGTYASALWVAAAKEKTEAQIESAMASLGEVVAGDKRLQTILANPSLTKQDKALVADTLAGKNKTIRNFLETVAENNRLALIPEIVKAYAQLVSAARGEVEVTITSAQPLDNKSISRLQAAIQKSKYGASASKLKVRNAVNEGIIGGIVVEIGDRTIDLSVSSRIAKINRSLTENL